MKKIIRVLSAAALLMILLSVSAFAGHEHDYKTHVIFPASPYGTGFARLICDCDEALEGADKEIARIEAMTLSSYSYTYNGKERKPAVTVKDTEGYVLKKGTDYTVKYEKGRILPGKYNVKVIFKGLYQGDLTESFIIYPEAPKKITASQTSDSITLKWKKTPGASGYVIYYNQYGFWERVKTVTSPDTLSCTIKKLNAGTNYKFRIKAYKKDDGTIWSKSSDTITVPTAPAKTSKITFTSTKNSITLEWKKVKGANGYIVYQKNGDNWKKIKETTKLTYTIKKLKADTDYTFAIKARTKSETYDITGAFKTKSVSTRPESVKKPSAPTGLTATSYTTKIKFNWKAVKGANLYKIYILYGDNWLFIDTTTKPTYTLSNPEYLSCYNKFAVRACLKLDDKTTLSGKLTEIEAYTKPAAPQKISVVRMANAISLEWFWNFDSWGYPAGDIKYHVAGFRISYKKANSSKWEKTFTSDSYKVYETYIPGLKANTTYIFSVQPYYETKSGNFYGDSLQVKAKTLTGKEKYHAINSEGLKFYPVSSKAGKALYKELEKKNWIFTYFEDPFYECKTKDGTLLIYYEGCISGYDKKGYQYNTLGKLVRCTYCGEICGQSPGTCNGGCILVFS